MFVVLVMCRWGVWSGGAFFPMFAALTPDYFGENHNATNYGLVYSAKLVSGLFGLGVASYVVSTWGYDGAYTIAGIIAFVSAFIALFLKQPGRGADVPATNTTIVGGRTPAVESGPA